MKKQTFNKIVICLVIANIFFLCLLFCKKNTPIYYFKYKNELKQKTNTYNNLIRERQMVEQTTSLLSRQEPDKDVLENILRQSLQMSTSDEKIVILDDKDK